MDAISKIPRVRPYRSKLSNELYLVVQRISSLALTAVVWVTLRHTSNGMSLIAMSVMEGIEMSLSSMSIGTSMPQLSEEIETGNDLSMSQSSIESESNQAPTEEDMSLPELEVPAINDGSMSTPGEELSVPSEDMSTPFTTDAMTTISIASEISMSMSMSQWDISIAMWEMPEGAIDDERHLLRMWKMMYRWMRMQLHLK
jgi:hypothetical protein